MDRLPPTFVTTRRSLHRVAEHVLAPLSYAALGKIGLRPAPGGFRTQEFGDRCLTVADGELDGTPLDGAQLMDLRAAHSVVATIELPYAAETTLDDEPLRVDKVACTALGDWYAFVATTLRAIETPAFSEQQIWPEHFDLAADADEVTYGGSPGDDTYAEPYLYVAPWDKSASDTFDDPWGWTLHHRDIQDPDSAKAFFRAH
jgi:hypothetical protein